jgi:hypothetical protein
MEKIRVNRSSTQEELRRYRNIVYHNRNFFIPKIIVVLRTDLHKMKIKHQIIGEYATKRCFFYIKKLTVNGTVKIMQSNNYQNCNKLIMYNNDPYLFDVLVNLLKMNTIKKKGVKFYVTAVKHHVSPN